jgi:hypothetical protein
MDGYQNQEEFEADQEEFEPWDSIYYCNKVKISLSFWILNVIVQCFNVLRLKITKNVIMILVFYLLGWWW